MYATNKIVALAIWRDRFRAGNRSVARSTRRRQVVPWPRRRRLFGLVFALCSAAAAGSPEVRQLAIGSSAGPDSTYSAGDRISVTVQFDAAVDVTGTPVLQIDVGGTTRRAAMWMHRGSRVHFGYSVRAADDDPDGISIPAGAIKLAGGRINGTDGTAAALSLRGHAVANAPEHRVDGAGVWPPSVASVSVTSNPGVDGAYNVGEVIEVTVEFDEVVFVEGLPTVAVRVGDESREAPYREGSGTQRLTFTTRVWNGDFADGGIVLPESGLAGGAGIKDADGNIAETDYAAPGRQPRHRVDTIGPRVIGLEVLSSPPSGGVYGEGDLVAIEVTFDEDVYLTGNARMPVWPEAPVQPRYATAVRSGGRSILFHHNVVPEDVSARFQIGRGQLSGTPALERQWPSIRDRAGNEADPTYSGSGRFHNVSLDGGRADTTPPDIHSVSMVSMPRNGTTYRRGEVIAVRVVFTEPLQAESQGSLVELELVLGTERKSLRGWIGSGARFATFTYAVSESDVDTDGLSLSGTVTVGPVRDAAGNRIDGESLDFSTATDASHKVNGRQGDLARPRLIQSRRTRSGGQLMFDGMVEARGTPVFLVGGERRPSRFGQPRHSFRDRDISLWFLDYGFPAIRGNDFDPDGVELPADGWADVSFHDARGQPVEVRPQDIAVPGQESLILGPAFAGVALKPPPHGGTSYGEGNVLEFAVVFDKPVNVDGAARLKVGVRELPCLPRNGRHRYFGCSRTIAAGENAARVELGRGTFRLLAISIKDDEGNTVDGDLSAYAETIQPFSIDTNRPLIRSVGIASPPAANGTFGAGAVVSVVVRFSEPVVATGSEQLAIVIGDDTRLASFAGNAGDDGLRFGYVVSRADADANGIAIPADALRLEGGAITDLAGNPASLAHGAVGDRNTHRVDGSAADISTTPVQISIGTAPAAALGTPSVAAGSSLTWQATSAWAGQPRMAYTVEANHPDVLVGRASGRVRLGQSVTNNLRMPCKAAGTANVRLTISVKDTRMPVAWDVLCREGVIRVREVEVFQGPLAGRFALDGAAGRVDAIANRQSVVRVHVEHESAATPPLAAGIHVAGVDASLEADHAGSMRNAGKWVSRYTVPLAAAQFARGNGLDLVADPGAHLDADVIATPRLNFASLTPKTLPALKPVFVPIQVGDTTPTVNAKALLDVARSLLPIAGVSARVRVALVYEPSAGERSGSQVDADRLFDTVVQLANEEGAADEFHIAVAAMPEGWASDSNHVYGGANQVVIGDSGLAELVAVGLGWGMGLQSVPCQALGDPAFPHAGIGAEGSYSFLEQRFITAAENYYDLMSDCAPKHISTYSYQKALAWSDGPSEAAGRNQSVAAVGANAGGNRATSTQAANANAGVGQINDMPAIIRSLALSGSVDEHGFWSLFASATSTAPPRTDAAGDFILTLHDDSGIEMHRQPLASAAGGRVSARRGTWAVRVPMQPREVHAVRIRDARGNLLLDTDVHLPAKPQEHPR